MCFSSRCRPAPSFKPLSELNFGFADAENYRRRENRDLFNQIFFRTENLDQLCDSSTFFLLGEKGTGKTAYAVYMANTSYRNHLALHKYIRETEYNKFVSMKHQNNLSLSDYENVWKVIIYLLLSKQIIDAGKEVGLLMRFRKLKALQDAIDTYYNHAFSPEIINALQFVERSGASAKLIANALGVEFDTEVSQEFNLHRFQTNLLFIQRQFEDALGSLKLTFNYMLLIDGIDIRLNSIPYEEYLECIRRLANAVWSVDNDFFPSTRDTKARLRVVLLVRPDIFNSLGLQNRNTKLRDNFVLLDWRTTYNDYRRSSLFEISDKILRAQQEVELATGQAWDHYFPFDASTVHATQSGPSSFVVFLRYSFHRPRDIIAMLKMLRDTRLAGGKEAPPMISYSELFRPEFRNAYSTYLLGEVRDQLVFYYTDEEFETFLKFFQFLHGRSRFDYKKYLEAFDEFESTYLQPNDMERPEFARTAQEFLQFLYQLNVICYMERAEDGESFISWCFRERNPTNISPKVKTDAVYEIHYGLTNALNTGKPLRKNRGKGKAE